MSAVNELMKTLITNEFPEAASLPDIVRTYLEKTDELPEWARGSWESLTAEIIIEGTPLRES